MSGSKITFYDGVKEVGSNKILLDFGKGSSRRAMFVEGYLKSRSGNGLVDFDEMGLIPDVDGFYRDDLLEMAGRKTSTPTRTTSTMSRSSSATSRST